MLLNIKPKYFYDQQGKPKTVMLSHKDFTKLQEIIEDFEDKVDLLKAEKEAVGFTLYEEFRYNWLSK